MRNGERGGGRRRSHGLFFLTHCVFCGIGLAGVEAKRHMMVKKAKGAALDGVIMLFFFEFFALLKMNSSLGYLIYFLSTTMRDSTQRYNAE